MLKQKMVSQVTIARSNLRILDINKHQTTSQYQNIKMRLPQLDTTESIQYKYLIVYRLFPIENLMKMYNSQVLVKIMSVNGVTIVLRWI